MLKLITNKNEFLNDLEDVSRLFEEYYLTHSTQDIVVSVDISTINGYATIKTSINNIIEKVQEYILPETEILKKRLIKKHSKNQLFDVLCKHTELNFPWGSMTGIRPTRLAYEYIENGGNYDNIDKYLISDYKLTVKNALLIKQIIIAQKDYYKKDNSNIDLYINIPICPTRCDYCSFISSTLAKCKNINGYLSALKQEITVALDIIRNNGYILRSIYVGGGTPTTLTAEQLSDLLLVLPKGVEFTVEAGRPDTISDEKLAVLSRGGVTRISVNPQTFIDRTLEKIGRKHNESDIIRAYKTARDYDFQINMDVIAGLSNETLDNFKYTVNRLTDLRPDNITVHTLCLKRGSESHRFNFKPTNSNIAIMLDYIKNTLPEYSYSPYYIYRQKNTLGNFENIGYTLPGKICINNINSIEEISNIIACGAGAISKRLFTQGRIERKANVKFIDDYLARFDEMIEAKYSFWNIFD